EAVSQEDPKRLEWVARYTGRPTPTVDSARERQETLLEIRTPPDPDIGITVGTSDPLDWIRDAVVHIRDLRVRILVIQVFRKRFVRWAQQNAPPGRVAPEV